MAIIFFVVVSNRITKLERQVKELKKDSEPLPSDDEERAALPEEQTSQERNESAHNSNFKESPIIREKSGRSVAKQDRKIVESQLTESQKRSSEQEADNSSWLEDLFHWLSIEWPMKVGAMLLILALGWFVTYAFIHDWIGPVGRISLGLIFGLALLIIGFYLSKNHRIQGNALSIVGSITMLITIMAGVEVYDFFAPSFALVVMLGVVVFLSIMSWFQQNQAMAIVVIILGNAVPLFVFESADIIMVFLYLFVLSAGILWMVRSTNWNNLTLLSLLFVFFYSAFYHLDEGLEENLVNVIFIFTFAGLYFVANIATLLKQEKPSGKDMFIAGMLGVVFLVWCLMIASGLLEVLLVLIGALGFGLGAYILYYLSNSKSPVWVYGSVSLFLIFVATALQFDGNVLIIAYTLEVIATAFLWMYALKNQERKGGHHLLPVALFLLPMGMFFQDFVELLLEGGGNPSEQEILSFMILVVMIASSFILAFLSKIFLSADEHKSEEKIQSYHAFNIIGGAYLMAAIWIGFHFMDREYIASMIALMIYTVAGLFFYIKGKKDGNASLKAIGGILFALVVARLIFVEFWQMALVTKTITFFVIGAMLISTAFIKENRIGIENKNAGE